MLPTEQFSGDAVPQVPWTPEGWHKSPDQMQREAQLQIFQERAEIEQNALGSQSPPMGGMSGEVGSDMNEQEELLDTSVDRSDRGAEWRRNLADMRRTDPIPGRPAISSVGMKDVQANTPS